MGAVQPVPVLESVLLLNDMGSASVSPVRFTQASIMEGGAVMEIKLHDDAWATDVDSSSSIATALTSSLNSGGDEEGGWNAEVGGWRR